MASSCSDTPWNSAYMPSDSDSSWPERFRALGSLLMAGSLGVAILRILLAATGTFPSRFCLVCLLVLLLGAWLSTIASQYSACQSLRRACCHPKSALLCLASVLLTVGLLSYASLWLPWRFHRARQGFTSLVDHVEYIQRHANDAVGQVAQEILNTTYSIQDIDDAYVKADLQVSQSHRFEGKGFCFAQKRTPQQKATVEFTNSTQHPLQIDFQGPENATLQLSSGESDSIQLPRGDYLTCITAQDATGGLEVTAPKHLSAHTHYQGNLVLDMGGQLVEESHLRYDLKQLQEASAP